MPSLKDLKTRISSVKATRKITAAMKMVAASKLRRAQEQVETSRPYAIRIASMIQAIRASMTLEEASSEVLKSIDIPRMMRGTGRNQRHLLLVMTSDRGLCGGFNSTIVREVRQRIASLRRNDKIVTLICIGRKGYDLLKSDYGSLIRHTYDEIGRKQTTHLDALSITNQLITLFEEEHFDICTAYFNHFQSIIVQEVTALQLIPVALPKSEETLLLQEQGSKPSTSPAATLLPFTFEPNEAYVLEALIPFSLAIQLYRCLLESSASEQGARMTAMDNATRNAGDMIDRLTLVYNRTRQAVITKELIEIISGAEAL